MSWSAVIALNCPRWRKFGFESTFQNSKTVSRSSVYREWVPQGRCSDGEGM